MPETPPDSASDETLLMGHDRAERIVGLHLTAGDRMRLYRRGAEDRVTHEDVAYHPFFLLSDIERLRGFSRDRFRFQVLDGDNFFRHLVVFPDRSAYWDALRHVERAEGTEKRRPDSVYFTGPPEQQYLTQTGRTLFKGMELSDLLRLQLDLEVYAPDGFPDAEVPEHRIILVSLSDNRGWERVAGSTQMGEEQLLRETVRLVNQRDPDVIEGHNIYGFDLPYLADRCRRHGVPLAIGRDGSEPRTFPSSMRFAERRLEFEAVEIAGRHVIDTLFQVMSFDVFSRDMPSYTLKAAARYFGFAPEDRTYIEGADIARVWRKQPQRLIDYALDDVIETRRLAAHLSGSTFYLTQMVPMPYGMVARTGPASKIESLFVRGYLHARHSVPRAASGSQHVGGYTDVFVTGVVGPVVYADVESLYPSIMLNYDVQPSKDALGLFPRLLRALTELRFETKAAMREADDAHERGELDARQTAYKNIINSFYGNLGFGLAVFNDFAEADRVASTGQEILREIIGRIREAGGRVIEVDTDGVLFVPPEDVRGEQPERDFVQRLSERMPQGIRIGFDGRYARMLSYKKKNYALLGYDGEIKIKGSSLVSRSVEPFGIRFVQEAVRRLLEEDVAGLHALYLEVRTVIETHDWAGGVRDFQRVETLKSSVEEYEADVKAGNRTRAAAYELAHEKAARSGTPVRRGERIAYYIATGPGARAFETARLAEDWNPNDPDEDTAYYLGRLDQFASKFEPFFESAHDFRLVFSPEDLFGFDASGIRLRVSERRPEDVKDDIPF